MGQAGTQTHVWQPWVSTFTTRQLIYYFIHLQTCPPFILFHFKTSFYFFTFLDSKELDKGMNHILTLEISFGQKSVLFNNKNFYPKSYYPLQEKFLIVEIALPRWEQPDQMFILCHLIGLFRQLNFFKTLYYKHAHVSCFYRCPPPVLIFRCVIKDAPSNFFSTDVSCYHQFCFKKSVGGIACMLQCAYQEHVYVFMSIFALFYPEFKKKSCFRFILIRDKIGSVLNLHFHW